MIEVNLSSESPENKKMIQISKNEYEKMRKEISELKEQLKKEKQEKEELRNILEKTNSAIDSFDESKKNIEKMFEFLKKQIQIKDEKINQFELNQKLNKPETNNIKIKENKEVDSNNKSLTAHTTNIDFKYQNFKNSFIDNYYNLVLLDCNTNSKSKDKNNKSLVNDYKNTDYFCISEPIPTFINFLKKYE